MMSSKVYFIKKVDYSGVIPLTVKITVTTSSTSPHCLMSTLLSIVLLTTKVTILSFVGAAPQGVYAVKLQPPPRTIDESLLVMKLYHLNSR